MTLTKGDIVSLTFRGEPAYAAVLEPELHHGTNVMARVQLLGKVRRERLIHHRAIERNLGPAKPPERGAFVRDFMGHGCRVLEPGSRTSVVEVSRPANAANLRFTDRLTVDNFELLRGRFDV